MITTPIGTRVISNITNPMYVAPSASTTFTADRTGLSPENSENVFNNQHNRYQPLANVAIRNVKQI